MTKKKTKKEVVENEGNPLIPVVKDEEIPSPKLEEFEIQKDQETSDNKNEPVETFYYCDKHQIKTRNLLLPGESPVCVMCYEEQKSNQGNKNDPNQADKKIKEKLRKLPINNLDSAWLSAEPDYRELQHNFIKDKYAGIFEIFNSSIRLANIEPKKVKILEYDLVTAGYSLFLGYTELALSVFFDVCSVIEVSHGIKGFRSNAMNKIIQEIHQSTTQQKSGFFGSKKPEQQQGG
jgi:hypothetical protein